MAPELLPLTILPVPMLMLLLPVACAPLPMAMELSLVAAALLPMATVSLTISGVPTLPLPERSPTATLPEPCT